MTWNYRLFKAQDPHWRSENNPNGFKYGMCEVYYNENNIPFTRSENSMVGWYESPEEVVNDLEILLKDAKASMTSPLLEDKDIDNSKSPWNETNTDITENIPWE